MEMLKFTSPMMHGPAVRRFQEIGDLLGYDYGPNDGIFGAVTERVAKALQRHFNLYVDGIVGPKTWAAILGHINDQPVLDEKKNIEGVNFYDRRGKHKSPKLYSHKRDWSEIVGVTLHQTGCDMPNHPEGWDNLNAHVGILQDGTVVLVNDPTDMIWHAQGLSHHTVGLEFEGNYYGIEGDERTLWKGGGGPFILTEEMEKAAMALFLFLREAFNRKGQTFAEVHAHRQSSKNRPSDPGELIWQNIGMPWIEALGASDGGSTWKIGTGKPIPREWNEEYPTRFFS